MKAALFRVVHSYLCEYMESVQIRKNMKPEAFIDKNIDLIRFIRQTIDREFKVFAMKEDMIKAAELFHETYFTPKWQPD